MLGSRLVYFAPRGARQKSWTDAWKWLGGNIAGGSETGVPDKCRWTVKGGNSLGVALLEGARRERRRGVDGL